MLRIDPSPGRHGFSPVRVHTFPAAIVIEQAKIRVGELKKERDTLAKVVNETLTKYCLDPKKALRRLDRLYPGHTQLSEELTALAKNRVLWTSIEAMLGDYEAFLEASTHKDVIGTSLFRLAKTVAGEIDLSTEEFALVFKPFDIERWREAMSKYDDHVPAASMGVGTALGRDLGGYGRAWMPPSPEPIEMSVKDALGQD